MVKTIDIVNEAMSLANAGIGVDQDGYYGTQCVDLPAYLGVKFFGKRTWGNAIDLLNSAASLGWTVEYNEVGNINSRPKAGAVFVMDTSNIYGHPYGHTGLVYEDSDGYTMKTIEQNVDGNADSLQVGGPARYRERDFNGVVGWFYFPVDDTEEVDNPDMSFSDFERIPQNWHFTVTVDVLNVRSEPSLNGEVVATYKKGQVINYDSYCITNGHVWISYIGASSGERRYVATGEFVNGANNCAFGSFE